ncbi:DUF6338 family protein [Salinigranum sp. GCM10025319]|uniref:DUF6338 family protein n=1 Tax=Salinigranum sp. GCM10025319 TaxID=3252687 RepID=UPI00361B8808
MQIDLLDRLLGGELLLLLALLPGFVATQLFIWQSGVRLREGTIERVAWSLGVGVVSAPVLLLAVPLLSITTLPPAVYVAAAVFFYGLVLVVAALSGLGLGQRYREEFHERYDAHPSLETAWAFLHLRTPRGFARVRTKSGEEFVGQVRFVGKALPNDDIDSRDILLVRPRRLDTTNDASTIPYATRLGEYLHLTGDDVHRLSIDATLQAPPDTSVLAWVGDLLAGPDDVGEDESDGGTEDDPDEPAGPHLTVSPASPTVIERDGVRLIEGTVANDGDAPATAVEVKALFVDADGVPRSMAHRSYAEIPPGGSEPFAIEYAGDPDASLVTPTVRARTAARLHVLATPTLSTEDGGATAVAPVRNVSGNRVRYGELAVRFYAADGTALGIGRGYVEDLASGDRAEICVPLLAPEADRTAHVRYAVGRVWTG